jgi:hypothetical protein
MQPGLDVAERIIERRLPRGRGRTQQGLVRVAHHQHDRPLVAAHQRQPDAQEGRQQHGHRVVGAHLGQEELEVDVAR